ncbi:MAG: hypothetical protein WCH46_11285 [bacterium]
MNKNKLGILIIHGMGKHPENFHAELSRRILQNLGAKLGDKVCIRGCWWDGVTENMQEYVYQKLTSKYDVGWKGLHQFAIDALGDPVSYLSSYQSSTPGNANPNSYYQKIHDRVFESLDLLQSDLGDEADSSPLMILAHSLGSVIITNYRWDIEYHNPRTTKPPTRPFEKMENLVSLITYGSNIPLFIARDPATQDIRSIQFPPNPENLDIANWDNVFSPNDVLGWPLADLWKPESAAPKKKINDIMMSVGSIPASWTPLSHHLYADDKTFLHLIETRIRALLS